MIFGDAGSSWCKLFDVEAGAVRIVPTRELPIALAFLEFLRNRRDPRRGRFS